MTTEALGKFRGDASRWPRVIGTCVLAFLASTSQASGSTADVNGDGRVSAADMTALLINGGRDPAVVSATIAAIFGSSPPLQAFEEGLQEASTVAEQIAPAVESAVETAHRSGGFVDTSALAHGLATTTNVASAAATPSGAAIVVQTRAGLFFNVLVADMGDPRLFTDQLASPAPLTRAEPSLLAVATSSDDPWPCRSAQMPSGTRALILAPFSSQGLGDNVDVIEGILSAAGYEVTSFKDAAADLARFRGDYLQQYDIVYIETHGAADALTLDGTPTTTLLTGERYGGGLPFSPTARSLSDEQRRKLTAFRVKGADHFGISVPWLQLTGARDFRGAFVFMTACESAKYDQGEMSLSRELFALGAGAHVGFDAIVNEFLARGMAEKALTLMAGGVDLAAASEATRTDPDIGLLGSLVLISGNLGNPEANPILFDDSQRVADEPYLIAASPALACSVGPEGGGVTALAVYSSNPSILYAGTVEGGVFISTDAATIWRPAGLAGGGYRTVARLAIDPSNSDTVYATAACDGVFVTTNGGKQWGALPTDPGLSTITTDPLRSGVLYGAGCGKFFTSQDAGRTWNRVNINSGDACPDQIIIHPADTRILYVINSYEGILLRSADGGRTFGLLSVSGSLALHPTNSQILYAGTWEGIRKSVDGGVNWSLIRASPERVTALAISRIDPNVLYASAYRRGVFKSTDGGETWLLASDGLASQEIAALLIHPTNPNSVYAGGFLAGGGVYYTGDGGASWRAVNTGLVAHSIGAVAIDPRSPATLYAAAADTCEECGCGAGGMFKSVDGGLHWSFANRGISEPGVGSVAINPLNPTVVYAGANYRYTQVGIFRTSDAADTWSAVITGTELDAGVGNIVIDPRVPSTVYAGTPGFGLFKSTDSADSWRQILAPPDPGQGFAVDALAIDPSDPQILYVGERFRGVFRTRDGGLTWMSMNGGLTDQSVSALAVDPVNRGVVYAGTYASGVFKSTDSGDSWRPSGSGLGKRHISALTIDPNDPLTVYAGSQFYPTGDNGLFQSRNGGATWRSIDDPVLINRDITAVTLSPGNSRVIYVGTAGNGIFKLVLPRGQ